jgi:hypothetical protein
MYTYIHICIHSVPGPVLKQFLAAVRHVVVIADPNMYTHIHIHIHVVPGPASKRFFAAVRHVMVMANAGVNVREQSLQKNRIIRYVCM